jgi:hypothetical protein
LSELDFITSTPLSAYDLNTESGTVVAGWQSQGVASVAADEAGQVLYVNTSGGDLYRWPYADPAPTLVGSGLGQLADMTFAKGKLYARPVQELSRVLTRDQGGGCVRLQLAA